MITDDKEEIGSYSSTMIPNKPAILFKEKQFGKTLVIADLHIGYVYAMNKRGIIIPYSKRPEEELLGLVREISPNRLIILGDVKHEIFGAAPAPAKRIIELLTELLKMTKVTITKGNHDGKIEELCPKEVEVIPAHGFTVTEAEERKTIGLWHGHAIPAIDLLKADITISGHAHPAYAFKEEVGAKIVEKVFVKAKWLTAKEETKREKEAERTERIHFIMPAFNKYIDGFSIDGVDFPKLVVIEKALDLQNAEVFTLDGILIGTIQELQQARIEGEEET